MVVLGEPRAGQAFWGGARQAVRFDDKEAGGVQHHLWPFFDAGCLKGHQYGGECCVVRCVRMSSEFMECLLKGGGGGGVSVSCKHFQSNIL